VGFLGLREGFRWILRVSKYGLSCKCGCSESVMMKGRLRFERIATRLERMSSEPNASMRVVRCRGRDRGTFGIKPYPLRLEI
jgi:hypothetical protein